MIDATTYSARRAALREAVSDGEILILGNAAAPRNYADNVYPFRQDSHFLYYAGVDHAGLALVIGSDGRSTLYGPPEHPDDLVWFGPHPTLEDFANRGGLDAWDTMAALRERLLGVVGRGGKVHYLPPYRSERRFRVAELLGVDPRAVDAAVSEELVRAVNTQRSVKSEDEIAEIEDALSVTAAMYRSAWAATEAGRTEAEIAAALQAPALARDRQLAFPPIVTVRGEVLHNESYANTLSDGDLLLIDSGAESARCYASDITRTVPVSGRFSTLQRDIYDVVLAAQLAAISAASPEHTNREVHLVAARTIAAGLTELGLMRGDADHAVAAGAHALFFPHGIGHMLGQDVHDMEDLGDVVGYPEGEARSEQFGINFLRLARRLEPGFVITIEPGIYFIPALIDRWAAEGRHTEFIRYDRLERYTGFGGVRIEDDILITEQGCRVLGPGIPKEAAQVEEAMRG
jgi:Xaa-Pro aminopeptidase